MNDAPDGVSADFVGNQTGLADGTYSCWFRLADVDSDLDSMTTLLWEVDVGAAGFDDDTCSLTSRIFAADNDEGTPLTDETAVIIDDNDVGRFQIGPTGFTGLTGTKTQWDGAYIRFAWLYNKTTGPDSGVVQIYGLELTGTYAIAAASTLAPQTMLLGCG